MTIFCKDSQKSALGLYDIAIFISVIVDQSVVELIFLKFQLLRKLGYPWRALAEILESQLEGHFIYSKFSSSSRTSSFEIRTRGHPWHACVEYREVGGWGRDPKKCTGRDWGMGSSTI